MSSAWEMTEKERARIAAGAPLFLHIQGERHPVVSLTIGDVVQQREKTMDEVISAIAKVCHEVNRAYCASIGDHSQPLWEDAPEWQRASAINGVKFSRANPDAPPSASHDSWLAEKRADGWKYGAVKNPEAKEHPCFVSYHELPAEQRTKDYLFQAVVRSIG